jgi:predicted SprT family Zn-dependent metalloprotease
MSYNRALTPAIIAMRSEIITKFENKKIAEKIAYLQQEFKKLNKKYLDSEYKLVFDNSKARLGASSHREKTIYISNHYMIEAPFHEMVDTLRHEFAHACTSKEHPNVQPHGREWREWAVKLNAIPRARADFKIELNDDHDVKLENCRKQFLLKIEKLKLQASWKSCPDIHYLQHM